MTYKPYSMVKSLPNTLEGLNYIYDEKEKALGKLEERISTFQLMINALDGCSKLLTQDTPDAENIQVGLTLLRDEKEKALSKDENNAEKIRYVLESIETSIGIIQEKMNKE